jgi:Domain of unknown function (DUF4395)
MHSWRCKGRWQGIWSTQARFSVVRTPSFPNPVNETSARVVAGGVLAMSVTTMAAEQRWLLLPLTYGFAARTLAGPRYSPLGLVATRIVTPRLKMKHRFSPGPPKRLAQATGLAISVGCCYCVLTGRRRSADRLLKVLIAAAGLEATLGICLGCKLFAAAMRLGLVPGSTCRACEDIWALYPSGRPGPKRPGRRSTV